MPASIGRVTDSDRVKAFAAFLGLREDEFWDLVLARKVISEKSVRRIRRNDTRNARVRSMEKLLCFLDRSYLAAPSATAPNAHREVAARLLLVADDARARWHGFLCGARGEAPALDDIEARCNDHRQWDAAVNAAAWPDRDTLRTMVNALSDEARLAGVIRFDEASSTASPATELVRWPWALDAIPSARLRVRMLMAFYAAQRLIERTAAVVYLGTPVPFSLLPPQAWREWLGSDGEAVAAIRIADSDRRFIGTRPGRPPREFQGGPEEQTGLGQAYTLLTTWFARWNRLQNAIAARQQAVVVLFSEKRTQDFFADLKAAAYNACVEALERAATHGAVLLATTSSAHDDDLCAALTVGGDLPGVALGDPMTTRPGGGQRESVVTLAGTPEYWKARACFEDVANSIQTRQVAAADIKALVKPGATRRTR